MVLVLGWSGFSLNLFKQSFLVIHQLFESCRHHLNGTVLEGKRRGRGGGEEGGKEEGKRRGRGGGEERREKRRKERGEGEGEGRRGGRKEERESE